MMTDSDNDNANDHPPLCLTSVRHLVRRVHSPMSLELYPVDYLYAWLFFMTRN